SACVQLEKKAADCYLGMLTVNPLLQNQGWGKKLLSLSETFARNTWNCSSVSMNVITTREELLQWYFRHGYKPTGKKKPFPMDDPRAGIPLVDFIEFYV